MGVRARAVAAAMETGVRARAAVETEVAARYWVVADWGEAAMAPVAQVTAVGAGWGWAAMAWVAWVPAVGVVMARARVE